MDMNELFLLCGWVLALMLGSLIVPKILLIFLGKAAIFRKYNIKVITLS